MLKLRFSGLRLSSVLIVVLLALFSVTFVSGVSTVFLENYPSQEYSVDDSCFDGCVQGENACIDKADKEYSACDPIRAGFGGDQNQYNCYVEYRKKTLSSNDYHYEGDPDEGSCAVEAKDCIVRSCIKKKQALEVCDKNTYQSAEDYCNPYYGVAKDYSYSSCIDVCGKKKAEEEAATGDKLAEEVAKYTAEPEPLNTILTPKDIFYDAYEDTEARFAGEVKSILAGTIDQLKGTVEVQQPDWTWKKLSKGDTINSLDRIRTSADGRLRLTLKDGTLFTLGANSDLIIDEFVYDPNAKADFSARLGKGIFRWVTEKAGKVPSRVNIKVPAAEIGPRGTDFIASYDPETDLTEVNVYEGTVSLTSTETGQTNEFVEGSTAYIYLGEVASVEPLSEQNWKFLESEISAEESGAVEGLENEIDVEKEDEIAKGGSEVAGIAIGIILGLLILGLPVAGIYYVYKKFVKKK